MLLEVSAVTMKNPEHESGYFEDGSDLETTVEETIVTEERKYGSACYGLAKAIHSLDVRDSSEPVSDHYEDRFNRGTDRVAFLRIAAAQHTRCSSRRR